MAQKSKKFYVSWDERHGVIVEAFNKEEAEEKAINGDYVSDEAVEFTNNFEIKVV